MSMGSKLVCAAGAAALVIGSAVPASAGRYDRGWGGPPPRHRGNDGFGAGAVVGAILGAGILAAVLSASNKKKQREAEARDRAYDPQVGERPYGTDDRGSDNRGYDTRAYDNRAGNDRSYEDGRASAMGEDDAVDACAVAARDEAARGGGFADLREITGVRPVGSSGYDVTGTIDQRRSYSAQESRQRSFRCTFESGRVSGVTFGTAV